MWVKEEPQHRDGMEIAPLCLMLSTLVVHPDRSQFLLYERLTLTCGGGPGCSDGWTLLRNTSTQSSQPCPSRSTNGSACVIRHVYPSDSGVYWCGSALGGRSSNSVSIAVSDPGVILHSPALPVTEGDRVTLRCAFSVRGGAAAQEPQLAASAAFYKDGVMIGNRSAANVTFAAVSRSDEGLYWCELPTRGTSPRSRLAVRAVTAEPPSPRPVPRLVCVVLLVVLLTVVHIFIFVVCAKLHRLTRRSDACVQVAA